MRARPQVKSLRSPVRQIMELPTAVLTTIKDIRIQLTQINGPEDIIMTTISGAEVTTINRHMANTEVMAVHTKI